MSSLHRDIMPSRRWIFFLSALVIGGVLLGTLMPMPYHRMPPNAAFIDGYRYFSWELTPCRDWVNNVLLFIPVGIALWATAASVVRRGFALPISAFAGALLSIAIEWTQVFVPGRYPCAIDVCMNSIGALLGAKMADIAVAFANAIFRTFLSITFKRANGMAPPEESDRMAA